MRSDLAASLDSLTVLATQALTSDRPTRLVEAYKIGQIAQQLVRAGSLKVEDFGTNVQKSPYYAKPSVEWDSLEVAVPSDLSDDHRFALLRLTDVMLNVLATQRPDRFAEVSRVSSVAQAFIQAVRPPAPPPAKKTDQNGHFLDIRRGLDPLDLYVAVGEEDSMNIQERDIVPTNPGFRDERELQENYLRSRGALNQVKVEESQASIARLEAEELASLSKVVNEPPDIETALLANERIAKLKQSLKLRNEGKLNAVVHPLVPRRHQSDSKGQNVDNPQGDQPDGHGTSSTGEASGEGPQEGDVHQAVGNS